MIEYTYTPDKFSHAAAVCPFDDGVLTAMYSGTTECHPSQRVYLYWVDNGRPKGPIALEPLTGNPILFVNDGVANIIYSKFEEFPVQRAHWWQHCTLWQRQIENVNGLLKLSEPKQLVVEEDEDNPAPGRGYLPRCHPIEVCGTWYLPLYREQEPHFYGVIMESDDGKTWKHYGNIGKGTTRCIQPTIWYKRTKTGGELHALLRNFNFGSRKQRYAQHSFTELVEKPEWSTPTDSRVFNANNSLVVADASDKGRSNSVKKPFFVWNHDPRGRSNLSLGAFGHNKILAKLDDYGSYPAMCTNGDNLHVLYTTKSDPLKTPGKILVIKHKIYRVSALSKAIR